MKNKVIGKKIASSALAVAMSMIPGISNARVTENIDAKLESLLGHAPEVTSIYEVESQKLNQGFQKHQPWSGSFWPDIRGNIANHYRQYKKAGKVNYVMNYGKVSPRFYDDFKEVTEKYQTWSNDVFNDKLSPTEKYDLLIGNENFEFTRAVLDELEFRKEHRMSVKFRNGMEKEADEESGGNENFFEEGADPFELRVDSRYWRKKDGNLVFWSGICDGWGPAAVYLPRPSKPVTVVGAKGHLITFYPEDLKALGSYLFARTNTPYFATMNYQVGGKRCFEGKKPERNKNGMVEDAGCNDLDAGLFHSVLVNRIGKDRMGFVFDIDNNNKINNHPVSGYTSKYFNPITGKEGDLKSSMVPRSALKDGYSSRRYNAKYIVGVKTKLVYMNYTWPEELHDAKFDDASKDKTKDVEYVYDLELDSNGKILGGEWGDRSKENGERVKYVNQPDFIWMSAPNKLPYSEQSYYAFPGLYKNMSNPRPFGNMEWAWDGVGPMPEDWVAAAKADQTFMAPEVGKKCFQDYDPMKKQWSNSCEEGAVLKSAQPLSHLVYFLIDRARAENEM